MTIKGKRCLGCMHELSWDGRCAYCDFSVETYLDNPRNLPLETCLNEKYVLGKVIGSGGFGITYIGWNRILNTPIAVKEYFPEGIAGRNRKADGNLNVYPLDEQKKKDYEAGMELFLEEARTMAEFHALEGVVDVFDFFRENATAYIVMEYIEGMSVSAYIKQYQKMPADVVLKKMEPVFLALQAIHAKRLIHRDISADNLMLSSRGEIKLIDFGAAKTVSMRSQLVTAIFKQGFAAPEQYHTKGKQGPWTDVYGLAASLYFMLTGTVPEESVGRLVQDNLQSLTEKTDIDLSEAQKQAIMRGLAVTVENRFHTVEEFYGILYGKEIAKTAERMPARRNAGTAASQKLQGSENWFSRTRIRREMNRLEQEKEKKHKRKRLAVLVAVIALVGIVGGGIAIAHLSNAGKENKQSIQSTTNLEADANTVQTEEEIQETPSATQQPLYIPDVTGMKYKKAKKKLQALGLKVKIKWKSFAKGKVNCVVKISPKAGKRIEKHRTVTLYVRKEKPAATASPKPTSKAPAPTATQAPSKKKSSRSDNSAGDLDSLFN